MENSVDNRVELPSWLKLLLCFFAFFYPFVIENVQMLDGVASYDVVKVIPLPRWIKLVEILFFTVAALYITIKTFPSCNRFVTWKEIGVIFLSSVVGIFTALLDDNFSGITIILRIQVLWVLIAPFLVFFIFYFIKFSERFFNISIFVFFVLAFINSVIGIIQFQFWGLMGDDVNGAMEGSHTFANIMLLLILGLVMIRKFKKFIFYVPFVLVAFIAASNQKAYVVLFILLFAYVLFFCSLRTKVIFLSILVISASALINFITQNDPELLDRFIALVSIGIGNSGIGTSYVDIFDIHNQFIFSYPFGIGIGNYANPINYPAFLADINLPVSLLFRQKITNYGVTSAISAFDMQVTYVGFVLIEVGFLGFFFIARFYYQVLKDLFKKYRSNRNDFALFTAFSLLVPIISSIFTLLYSMEQVTLIIPLMALAGMLCQDMGSRKVGNFCWRFKVVSA